ncbi:hypothetical protein Tco_0255168 [Tanacetum coccineum]
MSRYGFYPCFKCGRTNEFPHCPCSICARCGSNLVNGDCFNCSTNSSANNYSPNLYTTPPHFSDYSCHDGEGNTPYDLQDNSCVALCSYCRGSHDDYCCTQLWCENGYPICETCGGYHMDHECFNLQNDEFEEELKAQRIKDQEFLDTFKELCDSVIKKQREERERIAKEKEAEELEAERKKKECLKIENSLSKASTRSRRSRIDPSLKGFKVFCKTISLGEMQRIPEESVSSLKMGDEHLNTQKDSRESSVKYPIPTPRELDVIPDEYYDEDYQKRFDELVKDFLSPTSIYDNISIGYLGTIGIKEIDTPITPDIPLREETPRYFYDGSMDNGEDIIPLMRISKETGLPEKIIDKSLSESFVSRMNVCQPIPITPDVPILETVNSLKMGEVHFDTSKDSFESSVRDSFSIPRESNDLSNGSTSRLAPFARYTGMFEALVMMILILTMLFGWKLNFEEEKEEIDLDLSKIKGFRDDISCDEDSPGLDTDDDRKGDVPPFEKPLAMFSFPSEEMILKSKRAKTSQNRQETEEKSTREKFEKSYQSWISPTREKKVNEDQIEVKGLILTSFQSSRAHLDVLKSKDQRCQSWKVGL